MSRDGVVLVLAYAVSGRGPQGHNPIPLGYHFERRDYIRVPLQPDSAKDGDITFIPHHLLTPWIKPSGTVVRSGDSVRIDIALPDNSSRGGGAHWERYELNGTYRTAQCSSATLPSAVR